MPNHQLLNNIDHKHTKVIVENHEKYGDKISVIQTFPSEFIHIQKEYPILFQKTEDQSKFQAIAMLGLVEDENLFLENDHGWRANYIPAMIAKGPFLIGFQDQSATGGSDRAPVIHIDMDNPRVNDSEGMPVFSETGGITSYVSHINDILMGILDGVGAADAMFAAFEQYELLEEFTIEFSLNNGEKYKVAGNYTISEEKLQQLSPDALKALQEKGYLMGAYLVMASLTNIQRLVNLKNARVNS
ncbi:SapC family protein [Ningiella sp. W23]|uniref:SapC family protein n=1 Tax=Ningiella sp. W23 TaxID=3023715 RepID=UPI00375739A4